MASFSKFLNFEAGAVLNFGVICSRTRRTRASSLSTPRRTDYIQTSKDVPCNVPLDIDLLFVQAHLGCLGLVCKNSVSWM